ncbi:hypothetical protein E2C01_057639 [Portunus trituberculatus]|uniref:Uncharacterized protein n=1 Tax=Portunus trituberculatus TaxID=210409 RepID=A0A5B7GTH9_PORTR|nr:hypothetical protein [Portunus trituberculatus]
MLSKDDPLISKYFLDWEIWRLQTGTQTETQALDCFIYTLMVKSEGQFPNFIFPTPLNPSNKLGDLYEICDYLGGIGIHCWSEQKVRYL